MSTRYCVYYHYLGEDQPQERSAIVYATSAAAAQQDIIRRVRGIVVERVTRDDRDDLSLP